MSLLEIALTKLGLTPLMLSINNSAAAQAHLSRKCDATHMIFGPKYEAAAREAARILADEGYELRLVEDKRFPLWGKGGIDEDDIPPFKDRYTPDEQNLKSCVVLHSSGSVGLMSGDTERLI